jgi:predicted nucleic acid-binding protein
MGRADRCGIAYDTVLVMRAVLDTSVLVAAVRSRRGASFELLSRLGAGVTATFEVAVSVALVLEYEDALSRHVPASPLDESDIHDLIDYVCDIAIRQGVFFLWRPFLRDAGDDLVLELAVAAGCEAIVTHNAEEYLEARAKRASRRKFEAVLAKVPDVEPDKSDRILPAPRRKSGRKSRKKS